jgi:predicted nucleic acid-binding Zn ribbon protein
MQDYEYKCNHCGHTVDMAEEIDLDAEAEFCQECGEELIWEDIVVEYSDGAIEQEMTGTDMSIDNRAALEFYWDDMLDNPS